MKANTKNAPVDVAVIGGGLAGSEAALQLAARGFTVDLYERRPNETEPVHKTGLLAELVCSNSLKSTKPESAAGMLKHELALLGSRLLQAAYATSVNAGGALAVDRLGFAQAVEDMVSSAGSIRRVHADVSGIGEDGAVSYELAAGESVANGPYRAVIVATGPLTQGSFATWLQQATGSQGLAFYDAAAPIVMAESLDMSRVFCQNRYEDDGPGDYLNAPFSQQEYEEFVDALLQAQRVVARDFETRDLFQACQPVEEVARSGRDALRFGSMKPVGLSDPATGRRPWAVLQLRAEDRFGNSYNLVGCQTNLTFPEQQRVFRMVPGLQNAEFARFGVMHRNTFVDAPACMDITQRLRLPSHWQIPVFLAGQVSGTEGYCEAMRSGLHAALACTAYLRESNLPPLPAETAYGALLAYACNPSTAGYQPKHVNFGDMPPLPVRVKNKRDRYAAFAERGGRVLREYCRQLEQAGLMPAGWSLSEGDREEC